MYDFHGKCNKIVHNGEKPLFFHFASKLIQFYFTKKSFNLNFDKKSIYFDFGKKSMNLNFDEPTNFVFDEKSNEFFKLDSIPNQIKNHFFFVLIKLLFLTVFRSLAIF